MMKLCKCGHQDVYHHPRLGLCQHEGRAGACPCSGFVLAGGSTSPGPSVTEQERRDAAAAVLDQMLADALADALADREAEKIAGAQHALASAGFDSRLYEGTAERVERLRAGTWTSADLTPESRHVARLIATADLDLAAARRAAVLHPIAQTAAAEHVDVSRPACYGCGHPYDMHEEGAFGRGLACRVDSFTSLVPCTCPVYVETPPVDACGRCGHAHALHRTSGRCLGTGVDLDGNERARACACGMYLPEQPPELEPVDRVCLCGHPESLHGTMPYADQLRDAPDRPHTCLAKAGGGYVDSCIEFRPATITEVLPNGVILEHLEHLAPTEHRDPR